MKTRFWRPIATTMALAITASAAFYYFHRHPGIFNQLADVPVVTIGLLLGLYFLFMISLGLVFQASLVLCHAKLPLREVFLVTAYSSVINFFGPLQSGPAFRALYLKKKHGISLKNYTGASLLNYFFYALYSGLLLLSGVLKWWLIPVAIVGAALLYGALRRPTGKFQRFQGLNYRGVALMALAVLSQVALFAVIFYIELHAINPRINLSQALIYTGAANFALFVSITPGAIGFREAFVLFAGSLHHIPNPTIVAASLTDRGVYVAMLLILAVLIFGTHARERFQNVKK